MSRTDTRKRTRMRKRARSSPRRSKSLSQIDKNVNLSKSLIRDDICHNCTDSAYMSHARRYCKKYDRVYNVKSRKCDKKKKGGGIYFFTSEEHQLWKEYNKCMDKVKPNRNPWQKYNFKLGDDSRAFKKKYKKELDAHNELWKKTDKKCSKIKREKQNTLNKKYKKDIKKRSEKCCKCVYVKSGKTLRKVKGKWGHCSYDMMNCCKDKKTIITPKKKGGSKRTRRKKDPYKVTTKLQKDFMKACKKAEKH